jgi:hypothetical protein
LLFSHGFRSSSGSFATLAAISRATSSLKQLNCR